MSAIKCAYCGLTNFLRDEFCKRCRQQLHGFQPNAAAQQWSTSSDLTAPADAYQTAPQNYYAPPAGTDYAAPAQPGTNYSYAANPYPDVYANPGYGQHAPPPPPRFDHYGHQAGWAQPPQQSAPQIWREGDKLMMHKIAYLPDRCVKCNAHAERRVELNMRWHSPAWSLLILIGGVVYALAALLVSKTATVSVPLCAQHWTQRKQRMAIGWTMFGLSFVLFFMAFPLESVFLGFVAFCMLIAGIVIAENARWTVKAHRIEDDFVWLKKVDRNFLENFPSRAW